jgi:hypothetical protein
MSQPSSVAVTLGAYFGGSPSAIEPHEKEAAVVKLPTTYIAVLSLAVLFGILAERIHSGDVRAFWCQADSSAS